MRRFAPRPGWFPGLLLCALTSACEITGSSSDCEDPTTTTSPDDTGATTEPSLCGETVVFEAVAHDDDELGRYLPIPHAGPDRSDGQPRSVQDGDFLLTAPGRGSGFAGTDEAITWVFNVKGENPDAWRSLLGSTERTLIEGAVGLSFTPQRDGGLGNDQLSLAGLRPRDGLGVIRPWQETGETVWEEGRTYHITVDLLERFDGDDITYALREQLRGYVPATYADDSLVEEASLRLVYDICSGTETPTTKDPTTGPDGPPVVEILEPMDQDQIVYDGRDDELGLWYVDVTFSGRGTDVEDDVVAEDALVWTTDRSDLQDEVLGTGSELTARLYSDVCTGVTHTITLTGTDSAGNEVQTQIEVFIWTLC